MGMCKKCQIVYNALDMIDGYCINCNPEIFKAKKNKAEKKQEEEKKYQQKLNNILILSGTINKEHTLYGMVTIVAETIEDGAYGSLNYVVKKAEFLMREELVALGFDGVINVKIDSTVAQGKRKKDDGFPSHAVVMYGDAFTFD